MRLETWEDVTSCCRRLCAHLTSACTLTGAAVFGDLLWVRKKEDYFVIYKELFQFAWKALGTLAEGAKPGVSGEAHLRG